MKGSDNMSENSKDVSAVFVSREIKIKLLDENVRDKVGEICLFGPQGVNPEQH